MDSDDDIDSLPDQYARENCLSIDSRIDSFSLVVQINDSVPQLTPDVEHCGLTNDDFLSQLQFPTVDIHKQLEVPSESIYILDQAIQHDGIGFGGPWEEPLTQYEAHKLMARLKLDPPALSTDPDYDCYELARAVREQRQPTISPRVFPNERLDVNNDEGLEFPVSAEQFRVELGPTARCEKLDVPKDAIYHLARALKDARCDDEYKRVIHETMPCRTFGRDLELTPPLVPYAEHEDNFIPSVEASEIPIASSCSLMLEEDLKAAEYAVLQKELQKDASRTIDPVTLQLSPLLDSMPSGILPSKISSIRLESPLSPITSPPHSARERPITPMLLNSMDIDHGLSSVEPSKVSTSKTGNDNQPFDDGLRAEMEESAAAVLQKIEQEHISIADAMARIEVPVVDFSILKPEWQSLPMNTEAHMKWLREAHSLEVPPCPRETRADSKLRWVPFLQKIDPRSLTRETISPQSNQSQLIDLSGDLEVPTSASYVWKRPGLAILREPETEEGLEDITLLRSPIKAIYDLATLARRRLGGTTTRDSPSSDSDSHVDLVEPSQNKRPLGPASPKGPMNEAKLLPSDESNSAVSTLLSNFIDIRTTKRRKLNSSSFFKPTEKPEAKLQRAVTPKDGPNQHRRIERPQKKTTITAPCPEIDVLNAPTKLIKGLTLGRGLFSALERLYPAAEIIERDFDRWTTAVSTGDPAPRSTVVPCLAAEADVIISPITGIIVTTLLKVIQKPLPGHGGQSPIRERIGCVALRYERLIVLVSEENTVDKTVRDLTPSEATAYAEFIGFLLAGLDSKVEVFYVGGGEATLARWLVFLAGQHAPEATDIQAHIIHDETRWEVFLRRAGFNAYAAQAILVHLRATTECHGSRDDNQRSAEEHGLAAFVNMTGAARLHRFRGLLGGESVLSRVNEVLEARWS